MAEHVAQVLTHCNDSNSTPAVREHMQRQIENYRLCLVLYQRLREKGANQDGTGGTEKI
jgi:hypothetical protein